MSNTSTLDDVAALPKGPAARWGRRAALIVLLAVVVCGAIGLFGVHSRTAHGSGNGYTLSVTYPQTARAGLDVPWRVKIQHLGGFGPQIVLAVSADYFRMFETQGFFPDPDSATNDGNYIYFTFDAPQHSDTFVVDYDAYIQPASQVGKSATVALVAGGDIVAQTSIHTWLVP